MPDGELMFAFAHDLRAHLRTVLTRLELMKDGTGEKDQFLQDATQAAREIDGLLSAMVAYCGVRPEGGDTSLNLTLRGLLLERKPALQAAGAEVEISNNLETQVPLPLKGVLKELLTNACKFRDPTKPLRIRIATRLTPDRVLEIAVSDNGLGVAPEYVEQIFTPFRRLNSRSEFPGHGLGLATCRRLVDAWGGTIFAEAGQSAGLNVIVTVPITKA